jgi:hypothetical protein
VSISQNIWQLLKKVLCEFRTPRLPAFISNSFSISIRTGGHFSEGIHGNKHLTFEASAGKPFVSSQLEDLLSLNLEFPAGRLLNPDEVKVAPMDKQRRKSDLISSAHRVRSLSTRIEDTPSDETQFAHLIPAGQSQEDLSASFRPIKFIAGFIKYLLWHFLRPYKDTRGDIGTCSGLALCTQRPRRPGPAWSANLRSVFRSRSSIVVISSREFCCDTMSSICCGSSSIIHPAILSQSSIGFTPLTRLSKSTTLFRQDTIRTTAFSGFSYPGFAERKMSDNTACQAFLYSQYLRQCVVMNLLADRIRFGTSTSRILTVPAMGASSFNRLDSFPPISTGRPPAFEDERIGVLLRPGCPSSNGMWAPISDERFECRLWFGCICCSNHRPHCLARELSVRIQNDGRYYRT